MCNDFGNNVPYDAYLRAFSQIRVPVVFPKAAPNLEPRNDIWPTEPAPVFRRREDGVEMASVHYWDTDIRDLGHSKNDGRGSYAAIGSGSLLRGRRPSAS